MKIKNIITMIITAVLIIFPIESFRPETSCTAVDFSSESECLIEKCSISCYDSDGTLKIIAKTRASGTMEKIGFNNIIIQKSYDMKNWTDEKNLGDFIENDKIYCTLSTSADVTGGYYYRVICTHYAEGLPFRSNKSETQTAENVSKTVWINAAPAPTTSETTTIITTTTTKKSSETETSTVTSTTSTSTRTSTSSTSSTHTSANTTTTSTSAVTTANNTGSPHTAGKIPFTIFFTAVISAVTALLTRKKHE